MTIHARVILIPICLILFIMIMNGVKSGVLLPFDDYISRIFTVVENTYMFPFFKSITYLGKSIVIGCGSLLLILYLWIRKRDYLAMAVVSVGVAGGDLLKRAIKNFIHRDRPDNRLVEASGFSFPSGHAMVGMIFFTLLAYFTLKEIKSRSLKWGVGMVIFCLVLLIGISRIVLRVHFPTDVLAGFILGVGYSLSCVLIYGWLKRKEVMESHL